MMDRAPFEGLAEARSALRAALTALRSGLTDDEAVAVGEELGISRTCGAATCISWSP
jgi:hypothetical protein